MVARRSSAPPAVRQGSDEALERRFAIGAISEWPLHFKTDFEKPVIVANFERLGWKRFSGHGNVDKKMRSQSDGFGRLPHTLSRENVFIKSSRKRGSLVSAEASGGPVPEQWHFYWASVYSAKALFSPEQGVRLRANQIVNHFPNYFELTRKDLMAKNIKRLRREVLRSKLPRESDQESELVRIDLVPEAGAAGQVPLALLFDFIPTTYSLPADYSLFVEEFKRLGSSPHPWILKPTGRAQGRGIVLLTKLNQLRKWAQSFGPGEQGSVGEDGGANPTSLLKESFVISRYIDNPLLIGNKKFDLRIYVLVTSYRPLKVWQYRDGFCRFCNEEYSAEVTDLDNVFAHITNVAVQKQSEDYNISHGNKWPLSHLRLYLESTHGRIATQLLFARIQQIILVSLKAVQNVMINDKHCFELYGYDVLIDERLTPWLLEVNASPSLSATTSEDHLLKMSLIADSLQIVVPPHFGDPAARTSLSWCTAARYGGFDLVLDEAAGDHVLGGLLDAPEEPRGPAHLRDSPMR